MKNIIFLFWKKSLSWKKLVLMEERTYEKIVYLFSKKKKKLSTYILNILLKEGAEIIIN